MPFDDVLEINIIPDALSIEQDDDGTVALTLDLNSIPASATATYVYTQASPSATWTINHNLGFKPVTQAFNTGSQEISGEVVNISNNQTVIYFSTPIAGFARLL